MKNIVIILMLMAWSCSLRNQMVNDNYRPKYSAKQLLKKLDNAYKSNSSDSLKKFLLEWHEIVQPSTIEFTHQNDTIANLFQIFFEMYRPFKFGDYKCEDYFNRKYEYIVIQSGIKYGVYSDKEYQLYLTFMNKGYPYDTVYVNYKMRTLLSLRPKLSFDSIPYLYLTAEYAHALNEFLRTEHHELGEGDIMNTAFPKAETFNRYKFICPILPIVYGHWGGYWHLETFPIIHKIVFDDGFKNALVDFRTSVGQTVQQYRLVKKNGHWQVGDNSKVRCWQE